MSRYDNRVNVDLFRSAQAVDMLSDDFRRYDNRVNVDLFLSAQVVDMLSDDFRRVAKEAYAKMEKVADESSIDITQQNKLCRNARIDESAKIAEAEIETPMNTPEGSDQMHHRME
ncbi:hypothetical protein NDU88_004168 [Pleurodeles waltl]|uniref:Uncharacterized protein n=1 Tax=Pleurodeles waltl TaxID=8319 RepID=A0AAV7M944_PLEWA|nr:hypothetical protein NDU88_004168 [Pleurodeles waltl]